MRLLSIGDNCIDDYKELGRRFPGGNALNVAVFANRVVGVEADYIGVVGDDEGGEFIFSQMNAEGLSRRGVIKLRGKTAVTTILIRNGERIFAAYDEGVQKDAIFLKEWVPRILGYDVVHFTVWGFGREHITEIRKESKALLSCDFSSEFDGPVLDIMPSLDCSFFSGSKLIERGENPKKKLIELKGRTDGTVVMTLGAHGSIATNGKEVNHGIAIPVEIVDTLGTGDAFIAAYLISAMRGDSIAESLGKGHEAAAPICQRLGAWGG